MTTVALATQIPLDLKKLLDKVCEKLGLRKNFVVETALREKLVDLVEKNAEDYADLAAFKDRANEPLLDYETIVQALKKNGKL